MHSARLGDLLVQRVVLTPSQRDRILELQEERARPFGALAEEFEGVSASHVEEAWADQYAAIADRIDPRRVRISAELLALVPATDAAEHGVLPLRRTDGGLVACTTREKLIAAVAYTGQNVGDLCLFVLADEHDFREALRKHYPSAA